MTSEQQGTRYNHMTFETEIEMLRSGVLHVAWMDNRCFLSGVFKNDVLLASCFFMHVTNKVCIEAKKAGLLKPNSW